MLEKEIRQRAEAAGLELSGRTDKTALIRALQSREGIIACFDEPLCNPCRSVECIWKRDCASHPQP